MFQSIVRTDDSVFERVRDSILNRGDADDDEKPTGPGTPAPE